MTPTELRVILAHTVAEAAGAELPELVGLLAEAQARATARLTVPAAPATGPAMPTMLSAEQVAAALGVKATAVYEWARSGRIPVEKFGRFSRFDLGAVREALSNPKTVRFGAQKSARENGQLRGPLTARLPAHRARVED